jgi:hypothetical protein
MIIGVKLNSKHIRLQDNRVVAILDSTIMRPGTNSEALRNRSENASRMSE